MAARKAPAAIRVKVNRAPVLTLWAAVVAEHLGFDRDEAMTMGRVVAGVNAYAKGKSLGILKPAPEEVKRERERLPEGKEMHVDLLQRAVPVVRTAEGLRAVSKSKLVAPESVQRYLEAKFGEHLPAVEAAMRALARGFSPQDLTHGAYGLYEAFRPEVPAGTRGWGAMGVLDLARIRAAGRAVKRPN